ncbi:MAG: hypothetical protein AAGF11_31015 [Myxococcota bacterium]
MNARKDFLVPLTERHGDLSGWALPLLVIKELSVNDLFVGKDTASHTDWEVRREQGLVEWTGEASKRPSGGAQARISIPRDRALDGGIRWTHRRKIDILAGEDTEILIKEAEGLDVICLLSCHVAGRPLPVENFSYSTRGHQLTLYELPSEQHGPQLDVALDFLVNAGVQNAGSAPSPAKGDGDLKWYFTLGTTLLSVILGSSVLSTCLAGREAEKSLKYAAGLIHNAKCVDGTEYLDNKDRLAQCARELSELRTQILSPKLSGNHCTNAQGKLFAELLPCISKNVMKLRRTIKDLRAKTKVLEAENSKLKVTSECWDNIKRTHDQAFSAMAECKKTKTLPNPANTEEMGG